MRIKLTSIMVDDQPKALAFYTDVLGFRPHVLSAAFGMFDCGTLAKPHMIAFNMWGGQHLPADEPSSAGLESYEIEVPPAELPKVKSRLENAGVSILWQGAALSCTDRDGNRLVLRSQTSV